MVILTADDTSDRTCVFRLGSALTGGASEVTGRLLDALSRPLLGGRGIATGSGAGASAAAGASGAAAGASTAAAGASSAATAACSASTGCASSAIGTERARFSPADVAAELVPRPRRRSCA